MTFTRKYTHITGVIYEYDLITNMVTIKDGENRSVSEVLSDSLKSRLIHEHGIPQRYVEDLTKPKCVKRRRH